ncbi:MAG TPA: tripartite tricarboxylate transporter permease [Longimicrobiales bacterium]|nr:tripartite tricarboxylate transporter permease [Longimicrobiales bacterium]
MDTLSHLAGGFAIALAPLNLGLALAGVVVGTVVGMLPGIGPINAIAILIPVTFATGIPPESALILLVGIYYGSQYGNSISTILLNVPGTASAVVTALDGYALTKAGRAGPALAMAAIASFVGGTCSIFALVLFAPLLASWAIRFGPAEYFALMIFAFSALSSFSGGSLVRGLASTAFGLWLATVGLDPNSAIPRYTFGQLELLDGMDFVVVTIGLFAVSEVLHLLEESERGQEVAASFGRVMVGLRELAESGWTLVRASALGFVVGVLPGAGGTIASFLAYSTEERVAGPKGRFGRGDLRGVAAPEAANNASVNGAMIPLLTLGVPGSGTTAVLLGALLGLGIAPGPLLIEEQPDLFWGLAASMYVGNVFLLLLNLPLVGIFVRALRLPRWFLIPGVAALAFVAVYAVNGSAFDLVLMTLFGVVGYLMRKLDFPLAPVVLGLVLGPLMEKNLRRAMALSDGAWGVLFDSPIAITLWALALASLAAPAILARWSGHEPPGESVEPPEWKA